jgi:phosphopantothenoylcysteine decarboxylase/phosphopantothenate--cysteine ligase
LLEGKQIVVGVTGSIAAYKAADLVSKLVQQGAVVDVLLTEAATQFITPLTMRSLSGRPVFTDMFDLQSELAEQHVVLARRAEALVIAPATADCLARLAWGLTSDVVSLTALATNAPVLLAPAMDNQMWEHVATQANVETLRGRGMTFVGPESGRLASGNYGRGRLAATEEIIGALKYTLGQERGDLAGRRVLVTAGGTQEPIDPVRYITNASSGKQGYAIAEAARDRGADVVLITTPTALAVPFGVRAVPVRRAQELLAAVDAELPDADVLIMAAAVADFQPANAAGHKIKKREGVAAGGLSLELERVPDAWPRWAALNPKCIRVGFAAETTDLEGYAREKIKRAGMHLIVGNDVTLQGSGFGSDTNQTLIIDTAGNIERLPLLSKYDVGRHILDRVVPLLGQ